MHSVATHTIVQLKYNGILKEVGSNIAFIRTNFF